jgi:hypothetical protein
LIAEQEYIGTDTELLGYGHNTRGAGVRIPSFNSIHGVLANANAPRQLGLADVGLFTGLADTVT